MARTVDVVNSESSGSDLRVDRAQRRDDAQREGRAESFLSHDSQSSTRDGLRFKSLISSFVTWRNSHFWVLHAPSQGPNTFVNTAVKKFCSTADCFKGSRICVSGTGMSFQSRQ